MRFVDGYAEVCLHEQTEQFQKMIATFFGY